jgi:hypothetical protein
LRSLGGEVGGYVVNAQHGLSPLGSWCLFCPHATEMGEGQEFYVSASLEQLLSGLPPEHARTVL